MFFLRFFNPDCSLIFFFINIILQKKLLAMKKLFTLLLITISISGFTQTVNFNEIATISGRGEYTSYISKDGTLYKIGDKIKIGFPSSNKTFAFIYKCDINASGNDTEIVKIYIVGTKRIGYSVSFRTKGPTGLANYSVSIENAIATKEIKSNVISSDDALAELKKSKDKLDLGIFTQEQYDIKKTELIKYIR